ncbi:MAG: polysaccharide deacetylase family protein [Proteobacteria bacterium]|nr:polysaccharide deacetylase family protein [Pseudomonadota bacterium]
MSDWQTLAEEADRWAARAAPAEIWWRDDDAADTAPALERLLGLHRASGVPLALAVVPAQATAALAARLADEPGVDVLQHGYAHTNHAPPADKKMELGLHRPAMFVLGELGTGRMALERLFGARPLPVLVPPWNRIAPPLVPTLPEMGFRGLSTYGARTRVFPVRGLRAVNTHVDLVDWKTRRFVGADAALAALAGALARARDSGEPVGILSHHLAMDGEAWDFLGQLWDKTASMPGLRMRSAGELFPATGEGAG